MIDRKYSRQIGFFLANCENVDALQFSVLKLI